MSKQTRFVLVFVWVSLLVLLHACQPQAPIPTPDDINANQCLQQELQAIQDCIAEIMQPTDEEQLYFTAQLLLNALSCAHISQALLYATPQSLSMLLGINIDQIDQFQITRAEVFKLKGAVKTSINNQNHTLQLFFTRTDKYAPWRMTSVK